LIDLIRKRGGQATEIRIQRGDEKLALSVTPREDPTTKVGRIGTVLGSSATQMYIVQRPGPTPWEQVADVVDKTIKTISALVHSKQTGVGAKDLSGPVGILTILASQVNTDYRLALSFLVLLNVNLAIINLLPIPVLDGGHIVMSIIEKIRRRPLSHKFVEYTTTAFAVLLISFMLYVTFFDLKRFPLFKAMFKGGAQIEEPQNQGAPAAP
jgi:regulator of sigma E protease